MNTSSNVGHVHNRAPVCNRSVRSLPNLVAVHKILCTEKIEEWEVDDRHKNPNTDPTSCVGAAHNNSKYPAGILPAGWIHDHHKNSPLSNNGPGIS